MSGIYEFMRHENEAPRANPVGALGDISSALFAVIGTLAALRHRDATGEGQHVDVAMYDATVAMTDIVMNYFSMGIDALHRNRGSIIDSFRASDGWFVMQLVREHQFVRLAGVVEHPDLQVVGVHHALRGHPAPHVHRVHVAVHGRERRPDRLDLLERLHGDEVPGVEDQVGGAHALDALVRNVPRSARQVGVRDHRDQHVAHRAQRRRDSCLGG